MGDGYLLELRRMNTPGMLSRGDSKKSKKWQVHWPLRTGPGPYAKIEPCRGQVLTLWLLEGGEIRGSGDELEWPGERGIWYRNTAIF